MSANTIQPTTIDLVQANDENIQPLHQAENQTRNPNPRIITPRSLTSNIRSGVQMAHTIRAEEFRRLSMERSILSIDRARNLWIPISDPARDLNSVVNTEENQQPTSNATSTTGTQMLDEQRRRRRSHTPQISIHRGTQQRQFFQSVHKSGSPFRITKGFNNRGNLPSPSRDENIVENGADNGAENDAGTEEADDSENGGNTSLAH